VQIQKSLEDYLLTKRMAFPRFYFLSNDELLEILAQSREPRAVQPHVRKIFDAIAYLEFVDEPDPKEDDEENKKITSTMMRSAETEEVRFSSGVPIINNVENWLTEVERTMRQTLYDQMWKAVCDYTEELRTKWFFNYAAQITLTVDQVVWTVGVELAIKARHDGDADGVKKFLKFSLTQVCFPAPLCPPTTALAAARRARVRQCLLPQLERSVELVRGKLSKLERQVSAAAAQSIPFGRCARAFMRLREVFGARVCTRACARHAMHAHCGAAHSPR
jgi:hypothetical protein